MFTLRTQLRDIIGKKKSIKIKNEGRKTNGG